MKLRNRTRICVWLLAAMLLNLLAGCQAAEVVEEPEPPQASVMPRQSQKPSSPEPEPSPEESPDEPPPEPTPSPGQWDPKHRLDIAFTPSNGLELPVSGATGYATVKLPLWGELPEADAGKLATIYAPPAPIPEPTPSPSEEPSPSPSEEPSPDPEASAEPAPEPSGELGEVPALEEPSADAGEPTVKTDEEGVPEDGDPEAVDTPKPEGGEDPPPGESVPEPGDSAQVPEPSEEPSPDPEPVPSEEPDPMEGALLVLNPGTPFTILRESGDWWQVQVQGETGWVEHRYCLINLPDVIPSIIYNDTNSYSSIFVSSGRAIPNVTGKALYHAEQYNPRLGYNEFLMPVLYSMAKNVCKAQQNALAEGNTLVLYEGYRPYSAQMTVVRNLSDLAQKDSEVKAGISTAPWNISWFIATGSSNNQEGYAIDVSLAKVTRAHVGNVAGYSVVQVDEYEEYTMPTDIHELSMTAATYTKPIAIFSTTAWRTAEMAPGMAGNAPAQALQRYCTDAGLTPLASEWWHFNDLGAYNQIRVYHSSGEFEVTACLSTVPG